MSVETSSVQTSIHVPEEAREAMISEKPVLITRIYLKLFQALEAQNPFLATPLGRIKRRLLALNRLEFRALVAGFWKDEKHRTLSAVMNQREKWLSDPTGLIESLDGRLTWIEGANPAQLAEEAAQAPSIYAKMEEIFDIAARTLPVMGGSLQDTEHEIITAAFGVMAGKPHAEVDRLMAIKNRVLAMAPNRRLAMRAAAWHEMKDQTLEQVMEQYAVSFADPSGKLAAIEQKLEAAEALTCQEIDAQITNMPGFTTALRTMLEPGRAIAIT